MKIKKDNYKFTLIVPILLGLMLGISRLPYWFIGVTHNWILLTDMFINAFFRIVIVVSFCFFFSWIFLNINKYWKGTANFKRIFALISYSLIPIVVGLFLKFVFDVILLFLVNNISIYTARALVMMASINPYLPYFLILFAGWSFYLLITGNAKENGFSVKNSFISSFLLVALITVIVSFTKII
jgi:hypothetical protein